jgi:hypothetical protein
MVALAAPATIPMAAIALAAAVQAVSAQDEISRVFRRDSRDADSHVHRPCPNVHAPDPTTL